MIYGKSLADYDVYDVFIEKKAKETTRKANKEVVADDVMFSLSLFF